MKKQLIIITIFSFITVFSFGQTKDTTSYIDRHKYFKFLLEPAKDGQATLLTVGWQYLYAPWGKTFRTGGMHPSLGINLARFFSNKFLLGVFADLKGVKGFTQQRLSSEFKNDFNNNFITTYNSQEDSAKAYSVKDAINDKERHGFFGNYYGDIGIMFSPFPQKYGGIMVCVKKGYRSYPIFGTHGNPYIKNGDAENVPLDFSNNYAYSITFKPATFFRKGSSSLGGLTKKDIWRFITVGFYYEQLYLKNATFDGMRLENMVNSSFITKHGVDNRYGITLGLAIY